MKASNIKFYVNPFNVNRGDIGGETDRWTDGQTYRQKEGWKDGRTDMTKIIGAIHDYAKSPATYSFICCISKLASPHVKLQVTSKT